MYVVYFNDGKGNGELVNDAKFDNLNEAKEFALRVVDRNEYNLVKSEYNNHPYLSIQEEGKNDEEDAAYYKKGVYIGYYEEIEYSPKESIVQKKIENTRRGR